MSDPNIVARLLDCTCVPHGEICREAANEIERLRSVVEAWKTYSSRAERDIETLREERDEARREVCEANTNTHGRALLEAERRGWNCFKEASHDRPPHQ